MIRQATNGDYSFLKCAFTMLLAHDVPSEFKCIMGLKRAIYDGNVLIETGKYGSILAACRIYKRKRDGVVSVYQRFGDLAGILSYLDCEYELIDKVNH